MAKAHDIKHESGDLFINAVTGDFDIIESDTQHVEDIIQAAQGEYKESPSLGVGIKNSIGAPQGIQKVLRNIKIQLSADGYRTDKIGIKDNQIYVTGDRQNVDL